MRDFVLGKFAQVVTGGFGTPADEGANRDVLDVLALVQPFHPTDGQLLSFVQEIKPVGADAAARALRVLTEGGIAYQRGSQWRLMPDVLGDYLIERSCLDGTGRLSPFAERALAAAPLFCSRTCS